MNAAPDGKGSELPDVSANPEAEDGAAHIQGERHIPSVNRIRSLQSRVSTLLALTVMCALGIGLLGWYNTHAFARQSDSKSSAKQRPQGEPFLPGLGPIPRAIETVPAQAAPDPTARLLGPPPELASPLETSRSAHGSRNASNQGARPARPARPLTGPVLSRATRTASTTPVAPVSADGSLMDEERGGQSVSPGTDSLSSLLHSDTRSAGLAGLLPTLRYLLAEGTTIDCSLETAIDSSFPGLVRCLTATDVWSADGTVVLIEKGSQLVGETRAQVRQGMSRVFVLWTRARTPRDQPFRVRFEFL